MKSHCWKRIISLVLIFVLMSAMIPQIPVSAATAPGDPIESETEKNYAEQLTPIMGWSSWNHYGSEFINEAVCIEQMDLMEEYGLIDVGYQWFNIDDGYQGGRDEKTGLVVANAQKFPNGMKYIADYAHAMGMKAGIYTDAGDITCSSISRREGSKDYWNLPATGYGLTVGLANHTEEDLRQYFIDWGYPLSGIV